MAARKSSDKDHNADWRSQGRTSRGRTEADAAVLEALGTRIRILRTQAGISQTDLASRIRIDRSHLKRIEAGEANLTVLVLIAIANALGTTGSELLAEIRPSSDQEET